MPLLTEATARERLDADIAAANERYRKALALIADARAKEVAISQAAKSLPPTSGNPSDGLRERARSMRSDGATLAEIAKAINKSRSYVQILLRTPTIAELGFTMSRRTYHVLHNVLSAFASEDEYPIKNGQQIPEDLAKHITPSLVLKYVDPRKCTGKKDWNSPYRNFGKHSVNEINAWLLRNGMPVMGTQP